MGLCAFSCVLFVLIRLFVGSCVIVSVCQCMLCVGVYVRVCVFVCKRVCVRVFVCLCVL